MNLIEALQAENEKSREHLRDLEETAKLLGKGSVDADPGLRISASITRALIAQTEVAIASGDVLKMLAAAGAHGIGTGDEAER
jgi:hypothetical protein